MGQAVIINGAKWTMVEDNLGFLKSLRKAIPFLSQIPDSIYFNLDSSEFCLPKGAAAKAREELEEKLGCHIMTYNAGVFSLQIPAERHLCANLKPAVLSEKQLSLLSRFEDRFRNKGVSFVVYEKPLVLLDPNKSEVGKAISERLKH